MKKIDPLIVATLFSFYRRLNETYVEIASLLELQQKTKLYSSYKKRITPLNFIISDLFKKCETLEKEIENLLAKETKC